MLQQVMSQNVRALNAPESSQRPGKSGERDRPNDRARLGDKVELELRLYQGSHGLQEACSQRESGRSPTDAGRVA